MSPRSPWWATRYAALAARAPAFAGLIDEQAEAQVAFIEALAGVPAGARVLDLGCGGGRHSVLLQERGHVVTGLDLSEALIEQAAAAWASRNPARGGPRLLVGDMRQPRVGGPFDLILLLDMSLGMFDDEADHLRVLSEAADRLDEGGALVIELFNPYAWARLNLTRHFPAGALVADADLVRTYRFDALRGRVEDDITLFDAAGRHTLPTQSLRAWTPPELTQLLRASGLGHVEIYGSEGWRVPARPVPLHPERSMFMWVLARRRPPARGIRHA